MYWRSKRLINDVLTLNMIGIENATEEIVNKLLIENEGKEY
jgi:hypothetical protein